MRKYILLIYVVAAATVAANAQWPVELRWSGVSLGYPKIGADGENGAFVAGSGLAFDGWDAFLFHVDSAGNSLWEVSDSACYIAPGNQYPIALYPDGTGGCVALIDEEVLNFPEPSRNRVQIIRYDADGHKVWQYMPYDTTWEMLHFLGALAVTENQVVVVWSSGVADSIGTWYTRLSMVDGSFIDDPSVNYLTRRSIRSYFTVNDSLYFKTLDSLYALCLQTNEVVPLRSTVSLQVSQMVQIGDSILIVGNTGNLYLVQCLFGDTLSRIDTLSNEMISVAQVVPCSTGVLLPYERAGDLFCRFFTAEIGLGPELVVCDVEDDQYGLITTRGTDGLGFVWQDRLPSAQPRLHLQQWEDGAFRWPQGYLLADSVDQHAACFGSRFGYVASAFTGYYFRVQPIDSLVMDAATEYSDILPESFTLHNPSPNPFNGTVEISFDLPRHMHLSLTVYNVLGQNVAQLIEGSYAAGEHKLTWQTDLGSGLYFLTLKSESHLQTRKLLLIR